MTKDAQVGLCVWVWSDLGAQWKRVLYEIVISVEGREHVAMGILASFIPAEFDSNLPNLLPNLSSETSRVGQGQVGRGRSGRWVGVRSHRWSGPWVGRAR